ncbi:MULTISPECIES: NUDIX hydrolase [Halobacillus]|uniref:ADP-ribose pyrophosphatase YjhB, NUDIX family n=2 Tax=Halobacillus TaxID=45667 RepID=A0A1H0EWH5_HALAD|nr:MULTISPECIES: NUDIX hydrolase [Halobacillus]REJ09787.1 NUDIX domain-containing protein [Halobacillus trueperi]SDN86728.1 ADP-ribose pyrophosphatase YjhB, NUDIX family [Halobacillus aidingensis]
MGYVEDLRAIIGHRPIILVGSVVMILDEEGRILLQERTSPEGVWGLPGGLMELGESTEQVAKREAFEETGLEIEDLQLLNVYSGEDQFSRAPNGDEFYVVTTAYFTSHFSGDYVFDPEETVQVKFFEFHDLPEKMIGSHRMMIEDYIQKTPDAS